MQQANHGSQCLRRFAHNNRFANAPGSEKLSAFRVLRSRSSVVYLVTYWWIGCVPYAALSVVEQEGWKAYVLVPIAAGVLQNLAKSLHHLGSRRNVVAKRPILHGFGLLGQLLGQLLGFAHCARGDCEQPSPCATPWRRAMLEAAGANLSCRLACSAAPARAVAPAAARRRSALLRCLPVQ